MKRIIVLGMTIATCICMVGCVSKKEYDDLEKRVEKLESMLGAEETVLDKSENDNENEKSPYVDVVGIQLAYDFDTENESYEGVLYQLSLDKSKEKCVFFYYEPGSENIRCDFSAETYYELLDLICSQPLEKYENPVDSNGKIIYETVPHIIGLYSPDGHEYVQDPSNMDDIIAKFEKLRDSAR